MLQNKMLIVIPLLSWLYSTHTLSTLVSYGKLGLSRRQLAAEAPSKTLSKLRTGHARRSILAHSSSLSSPCIPRHSRKRARLVRECLNFISPFDNYYYSSNHSANLENEFRNLIIFITISSVLHMSENPLSLVIIFKVKTVFPITDSNLFKKI